MGTGSPPRRDPEYWRSWEPTQGVMGVNMVWQGCQPPLPHTLSLWRIRRVDNKQTSKAQEGNSVGKGPTFEWETASTSLCLLLCGL